MKKTLPSISVVLYTSKQLANGEHPIMLRVTYNNQRKYKGIGISCQKKDWNEKKGEVRATHPNAVNINTLIRSEKKKAEEVVLTLEKSGVVYSAQSIIKATTRTAVTNKTLYTLFEERIAFFKEKAEQYNTSTGYTTLLNIIKRYTDNVDVELIDVDSNWIRDFEAHLRTKYKDTSIKKFFDCLKAAFNYAVSKNYITKSPLENYTHIRKLDTRTKKRALSFPEITKLQKYYIDTYGIMGNKTTDLEVCKKHYWNKKFRRRGTTKLTPIDAEQLSLALFLCSYFMQGLALVDMANLKWKDLQDFEVVDKKKFMSDVALHGLEYAQEHKVTTDYYKIEVARAKTNHPVRIIVEESVLFPYLMPFTTSLKDMTEEEQDDTYVFPIYSKLDDTPNKKFGRMNYATYLVNNNLKRVGEKLGIKGITFYSARHSYASNLYHNNVPIGLIAQNMGRNPAEIETYLKEFEDENIIKANELSYLTGQPDYIEARKRKPVNKKLKEHFEKKQQEEEEMLKEYGGEEGFRAFIQKQQEDLRRELTEKFGDDTAAKIAYLQGKNAEK